MLATPEDEMEGTMPFANLTDAVAVAMEECGAQCRAFIVETCFESGDCCYKAANISQAFQYCSSPHHIVPPHERKKQSSSVRTVRAPQNIEAVRQSFVRNHTFSQ
jgi:hypothetical protein